MLEEIKNHFFGEQTKHSLAFLDFEKEFLSLQDYALDIISIEFDRISGFNLIEKIKQSITLISIMKEAYDSLCQKVDEVSDLEKGRAKIDLMTIHELVKNFYNDCLVVSENVLKGNEKEEASDVLKNLKEKLDEVEKVEKEK